MSARTGFWDGPHTSAAKDQLIRDIMTPKRITDVLEVFLNAGVDALYGLSPSEDYLNAIREAEQRTGRRCIRINIPSFDISPHTGGL